MDDLNDSTPVLDFVLVGEIMPNLCEMNSVERVLTAINLREPDRVPLDIGGVVSGVSKKTYDRMAIKLDLPPAPIGDRIQQLAKPDERFLSHYEVDTRHVSLRIPRESVEYNDGSFRDALGYLRRHIGEFYEMVEYPLKNATTVQDITDYPWPLPKESEDISVLDNLVAQVKEWSDKEYAIILDPFLGGIFEESVWLRGGTGFYLDLKRNLDIAEAVMDNLLELHLRWWEFFLSSELADYAQIVFLGDDYGHQQGTLISPKMFTDLIQPRLKKLCDSIKNQTSSEKKLMLHSCGSIFPLIEGIIAAGIEILNPIQPTPTMDPKKLKECFGNRICFHGGLDIQYVLPRSSKEKICEEVARLINVLGQGGGYIFATAHNILPDVDETMVETMINCFHERTST